MGVYFIIGAEEEPEIQLPGVFYIEDGIITGERQQIIVTAQRLIDKLLSKGRVALSEDEYASLAWLLQYSLPKRILEVQKQIRGTPQHKRLELERKEKEQVLH